MCVHVGGVWTRVCVLLQGGGEGRRLAFSPHSDLRMQQQSKLSGNAVPFTESCGLSRVLYWVYF